MQSSADILKNLSAVASSDPSALKAVKLTGTGPLLPSSFAIDTAAQATIAAAGLAAAELGKPFGETQDVSVDLEHAVVECRSERYLRVDGEPPPPAWMRSPVCTRCATGSSGCTRISGITATTFARFWGVEPEREKVQAGLGSSDGKDFETKAYAGGCVVSFMRSHDTWLKHPHAKALAECRC